MKKEKPFSASGAEMPGEEMSGIHEPDIEEKMRLFADGEAAGGGGGGGAAKTNRPTVIKRKADPNKIDIPSAPIKPDFSGEQLDTNLKLMRSWTKYRPTNEMLLERGLSRRPPADPEKTGSKNPGPHDCEHLIAEVFDQKPFSRPNGNEYRWLGEGVHSYGSNPYDDQNSGTDIVLMFEAPEKSEGKDNGKRGIALLIDATTNLEGENGINKKIGYDNFGLGKGRVKNDEVAWADTRMPKGQSHFRSPKEGLVKGSHISLYFPPQWVEFVENCNVGPKQTEFMMGRLKPFILRQLQAQLEMQAAAFVGQTPQYDKNTNAGISSLDRNSVEKALEAMRNSKDTTDQAERFLVILRKLWKETDALPPLDREQVALMPKVISGMGTLKRPEEKK